MPIIRIKEGGSLQIVVVDDKGKKRLDVHVDVSTPQNKKTKVKVKPKKRFDPNLGTW